MTSSSRAILEFGNLSVNASLGSQDQLLFGYKKKSETTIFVVLFRFVFYLYFYLKFAGYFLTKSTIYILMLKEWSTLRCLSILKLAKFRSLAVVPETVLLLFIRIRLVSRLSCFRNRLLKDSFYAPDRTLSSSAAAHPLLDLKEPEMFQEIFANHVRSTGVLVRSVKWNKIKSTKKRNKTEQGLLHLSLTCFPILMLSFL